MIGTATMEMQGVRAILGRPCADCKPIRFSGYYKFEPVNGDSCTAVILLSRWNQTAKKRDTIGFGKMVQKDPVSTYTKFEVPINYTGTGSVDSVTFLVVSSAGFNVINFMGSVGQVGNTMYVDELMLDYPAGIQQVLMPEVSVSVFPNPASDVLNVETSRIVKGGLIEVYSTGGKLIDSFQASDSKFQVPVYSLPNGAYYYRLLEGKSLLNTGTFMINR
jgi:hypothetical protein